MSDATKVHIDKFIDDEGYSPVPCPNCGGRVDITNSRDCSVLSSYASCDSCEGTYFRIEASAFSARPLELIQPDAEVVAIKYFYWASKAGVKGYRGNGEWD